MTRAKVEDEGKSNPAENEDEDEEHEMEGTDISVDDALEVLAQHLEELVADEGLKAASAELQSWITLLFERAKAARKLVA